MDVLTVVLSVVLAIPVQLTVMYFVYSKWILPAINDIVSDLPSQVKTMTAPYIDEKIAELSRTVKASQARFNRTVKQACDSLDLDEIDLQSDEGIESVKQQLSNRYGLDVALQAIPTLIESIQGRKKAQTPSGGITEW